MKASRQKQKASGICTIHQLQELSSVLEAAIARLIFCQSHKHRGELSTAYNQSYRRAAPILRKRTSFPAHSSNFTMACTKQAIAIQDETVSFVTSSYTVPFLLL